MIGSYRPTRDTFSLIIVLVSVLVILAALPGAITAQQSLSISIDAPRQVEAGSAFTVSASVTTPDLRRDFEKDMTLTMSVDGQEVSSKTVTVGSGGTSSVSFSHTFQEGGSHTVTIEGSVTILGQSFSDSASSTIEVTVPETATVPEETQTPSLREDTRTPSLQETSVRGAAFAVPPSLEDEVRSYRNQVPVDIPAQAFILATEDQLYIVFTREEPETGVASVEGRSLQRDLTHGDITFGVIAATSVSFDTTGSQASVSAVSQNPNQYQLELVRISATHRQLTSLTDPDSGEDFTLPSTTGMLVSNPQSGLDLIQNAGEAARTLAQDPSTANVDGALGESGQSRLLTFSFASKFWTDTETTVDGIVITPQSTAMQFISEFDRSGFSRSGSSSPVLYIANEELQPQSMDSVGRIKSQAESLDGELVEVEAHLFQNTVSAQELLEHNTGCGQDRVQVREVCVNAVQDSLLHAGVAWNEEPSSREDILFVLGASSQHQDSPTEIQTGRYRIAGEVVSTTQVSESLPEGSILMVHDLRRVGSIDLESMREQSRTLVQDQSQEIVTKLRSQVMGDSASNSETGQGGGQQDAGQDSESGGQNQSSPEATGNGEVRQEEPTETTGASAPGFTVLSVLVALGVLLIGRRRL